MSNIIKAIEARFATNGARVYVESTGRGDESYTMDYQKGNFSEYGIIYAKFNTNQELVTQSVPFTK